MDVEKNKKSIFGTIWESMTKTGGCCGGGESCCGASKEAGNKSTEEEPIKNRTSEKKSE